MKKEITIEDGIPFFCLDCINSLLNRDGDCYCRTVCRHNPREAETWISMFKKLGEADS